METHLPPPLALSSAQFEVFYNPLAEPVFLFCPADKRLVAANDAFRNLVVVGADHAFPLPALQFLPAEVLLELKPGAVVHTSLQLAHRVCLSFNLSALPVILDGAVLLLCIAKSTGGESDLPALQEIAESEKKAALKEVYHRAKNTMNIIVSLMGLQLSREKDAYLRRLLQQIKSRVYALALLQEHQYHSERLLEIKADDYLTSLAQSVISNFKHTDQHLKLLPSTEICWLPIDMLVPLALLTHELVANAVQHAFEPGQDGEIKLNLSCVAPQSWQLLIEDNGKGIPENSTFPQLNTLGSQLIKGLSKQLKAQVQVARSDGGGTAVNVYFTIQTKE